MYRIMNINGISSDEYERYRSLMSDERKKRFELYRSNTDIKRTVCGEMLARKLLAEACGVKEDGIVILEDKNGKPYAKGLNAYFSISHSDELVICAVGNTETGVDIEKVRKVSKKLINYVCNGEELKYVSDAAATDSEREKRFFEVWTFKEAYLKCIGTGVKGIKSVSFFDEEIKKKANGFFEGEYAACVYGE